MLAVALIVGLVIITDVINPNVNTMINEVSPVNQTVTFPVDGATLDLSGKAVRSFTARNESNDVAVPSSNFTIQSNVIGSDGVIVARILGGAGPFEGESVNISYTYQPLGYVTESGGRATTGMIPIFAALALLAAAISVAFSDNVRKILGA